ncbi:hypothetical protein HYPSUDRAFT_211354 [Hypholoma sublateritium FD-334 SS-4]|uniref:Uncharacterized protein n=1 Tax=Hypholoma sublateritium (strain FD-334 SS-4) TaxID=945553 RepID=A0A0D2PMI6_HYPSF|nr:hypothetical protein HYPSUDRAFT_211354 [Hypholoma sublateritium FD-334 SS-4]
MPTNTTLVPRTSAFRPSLGSSPSASSLAERRAYDDAGPFSRHSQESNRQNGVRRASSSFADPEDAQQHLNYHASLYGPPAVMSCGSGARMATPAPRYHSCPMRSAHFSAFDPAPWTVPHVANDSHLPLISTTTDSSRFTSRLSSAGSGIGRGAGAGARFRRVSSALNYVPYFDQSRMHPIDLCTHPAPANTLIDRLNLKGYANLDDWVAELDKRIEGILLQRLTHTIQVWCADFDRVDDGDGRRDVLPTRDLGSKRRGRKGAKEEKFLEGHMTVKPIVHEIRIQSQVIFLDPPIEYARATWIRQLHDWLGVGGSAAWTTYTSLLTRFPDNTLERPFALIETKIQHLTDYTEYVFNRLGDSLANWQQLLTEIKKARATFDTSDTQKSFGVCVIDYEQVQARLGNAMKEMHSAILKARNDLEHHSIEGSALRPLRPLRPRDAPFLERSQPIAKGALLAADIFDLPASSILIAEKALNQELL